MRARHIDLILRHHLGVERDANLVEADGLDRLVEQHLCPLNLESRRRCQAGDVARRDGSVELAALARLAQYDEALAVELVRLALRTRPAFRIARLKLCALMFELLPV